MKHYKSVGFGQISKFQAPLHKRKAPLLKTFWRRFWFGIITVFILKKVWEQFSFSWKVRTNLTANYYSSTCIFYT